MRRDVRVDRADPGTGVDDLDRRAIVLPARRDLDRRARAARTSPRCRRTGGDLDAAAAVRGDVTPGCASTLISCAPGSVASTPAWTMSARSWAIRFSRSDPASSFSAIDIIRHGGGGADAGSGLGRCRGAGPQLVVGETLVVGERRARDAAHRRHGSADLVRDHRGDLRAAIQDLLRAIRRATHPCVRGSLGEQESDERERGHEGSEGVGGLDVSGPRRRRLHDGQHERDREDEGGRQPSPQRRRVGLGAPHPLGGDEEQQRAGDAEDHAHRYRYGSPPKGREVLRDGRLSRLLSADRGTAGRR